MLINLIVFPTVTLALFAGFLALAGHISRKTVRLRERFAEEFGAAGRQDAQRVLYKNLDKLDLSMPGMADPQKIERRRRVRARVTIRQSLQVLLERANVPLTVRQLLVMVAGLGLGLGVIGAGLAGVLAGIGGCVAGTTAPFIYLHVGRKARQEKYLKQLPGAFELMARMLRAGQSVPQGLQAVAQAFEDPIAAEFASCEQQQALGLRPEVTYQQMAERSGSAEMRIFVTAMLIQRQTGGNLSDVLERLAGLMRARFELRQQIAALTAEGRLQSLTLFVLPFLMFGIMMVINRRYTEVLFQHVPLLVATVAVMAVGMLWIRRIVRLDV